MSLHDRIIWFTESNNKNGDEISSLSKVLKFEKTPFIL